MEKSFHEAKEVSAPKMPWHNSVFMGKVPLLEKVCKTPSDILSHVLGLTLTTSFGRKDNTFK